MRVAAVNLRWLWGVPSTLALTLGLAACGYAPSQPPDFSRLVQQVSPSVVNISATTADTDAVTTAQPGKSPGVKTPDWMRKYLQDHGTAPPASGSAQAPGTGAGDGEGGADDGDGDGGDGPQSLGSGFVLWPDGYILTNEHVVEGADEITVRLSDGRQLSARVVGTDHRSDLALLKVAATNLPAVQVADKRELRVGQWVLAIGSPFGFEYSVTAGIVSAIGRDLDTEPYVPFIQTDAAINPGNSGGPLFNMKGQVVGINSQIYSQTGGFMGVAFAIPIDVAVKVATELKLGGHVRRGWMGVVVQEVTRKLAASFGLKIPRGALVTHVAPGGPADQSGLRAGDVILDYDGTPLHSSRNLPPLVGNSEPGQTVTLRLLRDRHIVTVKVQLGLLAATKGQSDVAIVPSPNLAPQSATAPDFGLGLRALTAQDRRGAGVSGGVVVVAVGPGPGRDAGLQTGDIILSLAGQHVDSPDQFRHVAQRLTPGASVPILVQRQSGPVFLALQAPAR